MRILVSKHEWCFSLFLSRNSEINATICGHCSFIKWYLYVWRWIFLFNNSFIFTCWKCLRGLDDARNHIDLPGKKSSVLNVLEKYMYLNFSAKIYLHFSFTNKRLWLNKSFNGEFVYALIYLIRQELEVKLKVKINYCMSYCNCCSRLFNFSFINDHLS